MFSPYYAARRRAGAARAIRHCALNVALYLPHSKRWAMTERGERRVLRRPDHLAIGPSALTLSDGRLRIDIAERCAPWPHAIKGSVTVSLPHLSTQRFALDQAGCHVWWPIAPRVRIEVALDDPGARWSGEGYFDSNMGVRPLERDFFSWNWSRACMRDGRTLIFYDVAARHAACAGLALAFDAHGACTRLVAPPQASLPSTRWGMAGAVRADADCTPSVLRRLEDGPFYTRSLINTQFAGEAAVAFHESVSLERFATRWVQTLLPFRMPRNPF